MSPAANGGTIGIVADEPTDGELIRRSLDAPDLFAEIYTAHYTAIFRYVSSAFDRQWAEDIAGEVFLRAFRDRDRFDPTYETARPWLYGIASNLIQDHLRQTARQYRAFERTGLPDNAGGGFEDEVASRVDAAGAAPILQEALTALRPEEASVVLLYVTGDRTYQEIADVLKIPIGTVRSRLSRARQTLRNSWADIDEPETGGHSE